MIPETAPIASAPGKETNPAAGVIPTSPAMAPDARPNSVGFLLYFHSTNSQARPLMAAAVFVTRNAEAAIPSAASALPALNPNHPNHKSPAPRAVNVTLDGIIASFPYPFLFPRNKASTSPETPALM